MRLQQLDPKDDQFRDYGNNPLKFLGKMVGTSQSNGWTTIATIMSSEAEDHLLSAGT